MEKFFSTCFYRISPKDYFPFLSADSFIFRENKQIGFIVHYHKIKPGSLIFDKIPGLVQSEYIGLTTLYLQVGMCSIETVHKCFMVETCLYQASMKLGRIISFTMSL